MPYSDPNSCSWRTAVAYSHEVYHSHHPIIESNNTDGNRISGFTAISSHQPQPVGISILIQGCSNTSVGCFPTCGQLRM